MGCCPPPPPSGINGTHEMHHLQSFATPHILLATRPTRWLASIIRYESASLEPLSGQYGYLRFIGRNKGVTAYSRAAKHKNCELCAKSAKLGTTMLWVMLINLRHGRSAWVTLKDYCVCIFIDCKILFYKNHTSIWLGNTIWTNKEIYNK